MVEFGLVHDAMRHYYRGRIFDSTGEIDIAIEEYEKAIEMGADYADIFNSLGKVYAKKGHFDRALSAFQTALNKNPHYLEAQRNLSELQTKLTMAKREQLLSTRSTDKKYAGFKILSKLKMPLLAGISVTAFILLVILFSSLFSSKPKVQTFIAPSENISGIISEGRNVWLCDWEKQQVFKSVINGDNLVTGQIYHFKDIFPFALASGNNYLWTCDSWSKKINKHIYDEKLSVIGSYAMNNIDAGFLCFDGNNLWSLDINTKKIYRHNMSDPQLSPDMNFESQCKKPLGLFFDGKNYWAFDAEYNIIYRYNKNFSITARYQVNIPASNIIAVFLDNKYLWLVFKENLQIVRYPRKMFIK